MNALTKKLFWLYCFSLVSQCTSDQELSQCSFFVELQKMYELRHNQPSDINEHLPVLRDLATDCKSVVEIGLRDLVSTWAVLHGLSANSDAASRTYVGIDIETPPSNQLALAERLSIENGISFKFVKGNDMIVDIEPADMLFIDSLHTYCHLTYELEKFSQKINKYIALHDTSEPWGNRDDSAYHGDYSEYPATIARTKRGLWPAVVDFLSRHPEWSLQERHLNNHGLTVLKRSSN